MDVAEHVAALRREGDRLAATIAATDPAAPVPTCPGWTLRDLVHHVGGVHRWAAAHVAERRTEEIDGYDALVGAPPGDAHLVEWFRDGHAHLVTVLETAPADVDCFTFLPAPSPLAFWARRQAHETAIHRADAESCTGPMTPVPPAFGVDGVDELLFGFVSRPRGRLRADPARSIHLHATDADGEWLVVAERERVAVSREHSRADCAVRGPASDLYLLLWNRRDLDGLEVFGDATFLDLWRETVRVRWS